MRISSNRTRTAASRKGSGADDEGTKMAFATIRSTAAPNVISSRAILNFELTPGSACKLLRATVQSIHSLSGLSVSWAEQMANSADQTTGMLTCSRAYSSHDSGWFGFDSLNNTPLVQLGSSEMACQVSGHSWKTQHYVNDTNRVNVNASVHGFDKKHPCTATFS